MLSGSPSHGRFDDLQRCHSPPGQVLPPVAETRQTVTRTAWSHHRKDEEHPSDAGAHVKVEEAEALVCQAGISKGLSLNLLNLLGA